MKIKLDENLGERGKATLVDAGHDVATVGEQMLNGAIDEDLIEVCRAEQRCLITMDLDFANPLRFPPASYSGIAILRIPRSISLASLTRACETLVAGLENDTIAGCLWIVEQDRIRKYSPA